MKTKYANGIISNVLSSMVDEDRLGSHKARLIDLILSDLFYGKKIRINNYLDHYKECFEELKNE